MGKIIDSAVDFGIQIANDNRHGYDQINRWGPEFDCSSLTITCYQQAGVRFKEAGATYTENIVGAAEKCGFENVIKTVGLSSGKGIKKGDICLNRKNHVVLAATDGGSRLINASSNEFGRITGGKPGDQTGREIYVRSSWYNYPWDYIYRLTSDTDIVIPTPPILVVSGPVAVVQAWLKATYNPYLVVDGVFGPITFGTIVQAVQKEIGVKVDGDFGPISKKAFPVLKLGARCNLVKLTAAMLICRGYPVQAGLTDYYSTAFANDVYNYQVKMGLQRDREAGRETAYKLFR